MYRDQPGGQVYGQGPYYAGPYGQSYPSQPSGQAAAFIPSAAYAQPNGSTPQQQQQQYANQQRAGFAQQSAQGYNQGYGQQQAYNNLSARYQPQANQYGSPQTGQATIPSNYQAQPYNTGSPYAANQQVPTQQGPPGQQRYNAFPAQQSQQGQYIASSGQPSPAQ